MVAILGVYHRDGKCVGTCDARCYGALQPSELKEPRRNACTCICGGVNHGAGELRALKNAVRGAAISDRALGQFAEHNELNPYDLVVIDRTCNSKDKARALAAAALSPPPIGPDDLFYCDDVSDGTPAATNGADAIEGSGGDASKRDPHPATQNP